MRIITRADTANATTYLARLKMESCATAKGSATVELVSAKPVGAGRVANVRALVQDPTGSPATAMENAFAGNADANRATRAKRVKLASKAAKKKKNTREKTWENRRENKI